MSDTPLTLEGAGVAFGADLHIAERLYSDLNMVGDTMYSLKQIVSYCISKNYDLILAGDVFDTLRPSPQLVAEVIQQLTQLTKTGRKVLITRGQHDYTVPPWPMVAGTLNPDIIWAADKLVKVGSRTIYLMDWTPREKLQMALSAIPAEATTLVGHQMIREIFDVKLEGKDKRVWDMTAVWVPDHVKEMVYGDYHVSCMIEFGDKRIWSVGAASLQSLNEKSSKSFLATKLDGSLERVPLRTRIVHSYRIETVEELNAWCENVSTELAAMAKVAAGMPEELQAPLLAVVFDPTIEAAHDRIVSLLKGKKVHAILKRIAVVDDDPAFLAPESLSDRVTIETAIRAEIDPETEAPVYDAALKFIRPGISPEQAIDELRIQYMGKPNEVENEATRAGA